MREPLNRKVKRKEQTKAKRVWTYDAEAPGLRPDKFWCHVFKALNEDLYYIFCDMAALREEMDLYLEHGIENNDPSNPFHQPTEEEYLMMKENFKGGLQLHKKKGVKFFDYAHFPKFMKSGTISGLICHNQFGYDLPTMERIFGITYDVSPTIDPLMGKLSKDKLAGNDVTLLDTLAMSRTLNPDRPHPVGCPYKVYNITTGRHDTVGTHGLEAWGFRVTKAKPPIKNWNDLPLHVYLYRCFEDVEINEKVFHELMREAADLANDYDSITGQWMDTLKLSQKVYFEMCKQERIGVLFDQEAAWKLLKWIDTEMERISEIVEPQLGNRILSPSRQPKVPQLKWKKNGELTKAAWNYAAKFGKTAEIEVLSEMKRLRDGGDPVLAEEPMKISNQDDLKLFLVANGWRPTMWRALNITIDAKKKVLPESEQKRKAIEYIDKYLRYGAY
ncbi:hypothetical protein KAR91_61575, partial [Candidatus Pacearchaeota archaeon]|nr:hypothetical protein [Candidatus Pacearchaeota archaeon]